jgi:hypothetical protein
MVKLGDHVTDKYTKFTGVVTGIAEFLYGCRRILIQPCELKDGKPVEDMWFDEQRVDVNSTATVGGPQHDAKRASDPNN